MQEMFAHFQIFPTQSKRETHLVLRVRLNLTGPDP